MALGWTDIVGDEKSREVLSCNGLTKTNIPKSHYELLKVVFYMDLPLSKSDVLMYLPACIGLIPTLLVDGPLGVNT